MKAVEADVLVIGAGIAGLATALRLARDREREIVVLTREAEPEEGASRYAQGGIATLGEDDSPGLLVEDILQAGAGLSLKRAVEILAQEGPKLVRELLIEEAAVPFDRSARG
jgi:L-aspartate oxidase